MRGKVMGDRKKKLCKNCSKITYLSNTRKTITGLNFLLFQLQNLSNCPSTHNFAIFNLDQQKRSLIQPHSVLVSQQIMELLLFQIVITPQSLIGWVILTCRCLASNNAPYECKIVKGACVFFQTNRSSSPSCQKYWGRETERLQNVPLLHHV